MNRSLEQLQTVHVLVFSIFLALTDNLSEQAAVI